MTLSDSLGADKKPLTPAMAQYHRWKSEYPAEFLFFRMGDFFELFYDDAKRASEALGLALTSRSKGPDAIPMAGVPVRNLDHYLKKLVALGHRVAICDQIEDPADANGVVDRAVTRIVTAGTLTEDDLLERTEPNYLAAIALPPPNKQGRAGLAFLDVSTGDVRLEECEAGDAADALLRREPAEILLAEDERDGAVAKALKVAEHKSLTSRPGWQFEPSSSREAVLSQYGVATLDGFGILDGSPAVRALGAALRYVEETQRSRLVSLAPPRFAAGGDHLVLDRATRACLELTETARDSRREGSLLFVLDRTRTALGARRLREWLLAPLLDVAAIAARQDAVGALVADGSLRGRIGEALRPIGDVERLLARVATRRAHARDVVHLRDSLRAVPPLRALLADPAAPPLVASLLARLDPHEALASKLGAALVDDPPLALREGGLVREGFDPALDELRTIRSAGHAFLAEYQQREIARTGITNLKVGFNSVFGFYIEITNSWKAHVPADYLRKQTLKNCERYVTPELKEYESKVLNAEEQANKIECEIFERLLLEITESLPAIQATAQAISEVDALLALADVAALHGWTRPVVDDSRVLEIEEGRHPVIALSIGASNFVPNDCRLDEETRRLAIVTGPNMAGKSTYIRQIALIQVLAQLGSFVPAKRARLGVADRVFARVGASDDIARGHSTFMVEMTETANILNNATDRSLVILDEVGRGTSTFDGMALAFAISEHLLLAVRSRALFATHYHQLIELAATHEGAINLHVAVREWGDEIVFLHRIVEGGTDKSYGIHVARLAGIPRPVLDRAAAILEALEAEGKELEPRLAAAAKAGPVKARKAQAMLFAGPEQEVAREVRAADVDRMTPLDALLKVREWRERLLRG
jgi:DNA mismatch repair protein MutS